MMSDTTRTTTQPSHATLSETSQASNFQFGLYEGSRYINKRTCGAIQRLRSVVRGDQIK